MHDCPMCGSQSVTCRHCNWTWTPRDPENIPETCPRCRNKWNAPFKWNVNSKYGQGTVDPQVCVDAQVMFKKKYKPKSQEIKEEIGL